MFRVSKGLNFS